MSFLKNTTTHANTWRALNHSYTVARQVFALGRMLWGELCKVENKVNTGRHLNLAILFKTVAVIYDTFSLSDKKSEYYTVKTYDLNMKK